MELLFRDDAYARSCEATVLSADPSGIRLDRTVFYPMGGGQPGDVGSLRLADGTAISIRDTVKGEGPNEVVHLPAEGMALPGPGTRSPPRSTGRGGTASCGCTPASTSSPPWSRAT